MKNLRQPQNKIFVKSAHRLGLMVALALILPIVVLCFSNEEITDRELSVSSPHWLISEQKHAGNFSHRTNAHAQKNCNSCHQRSDNSITPTFAGHAACIDCHLTQFVTPESTMCAICHSNVQSSPPPMRGFPTNFKEQFNVKFDHAAHNRGGGRPAEGCIACHKPLRGGVAQSIPVSINAHNQCYSCHTANRIVGGRDIGSCNMCHSLGSYRRTSTNSAAFQANFSHSEHGAKQRIGCADCHSVKAGAAQSKQVSSPIVAEHFSSSRAMSCMNCHNDKRAFGERNFANCKKCHTQPNFNIIR